MKVADKGRRRSDVSGQGRRRSQTSRTRTNGTEPRRRSTQSEPARRAKPAGNDPARRSRARRPGPRKRERNRTVTIAAIVLIAIIILLAGILIIMNKRAADKARKEAVEAAKAKQAQMEAVVAEADLLAAQYDYEAAISLIQSQEDFTNQKILTDAVTKYNSEKSNLEAKSVTNVPHIFFHSLIVDTNRAFDTGVWGEETVAGTNAWMTTIDEFDKIIQQLYDNGYVLVRMRDLVTQTTDADGTVHFSSNSGLMLPKDKKPIVLSIDDWSYYHSYEGHGYGDKAVLDENGEVKVHYIQADGSELIGDYDVVPRLNTFVKEHPDFSYRGAKGIIAMTGYNGVFGYRTDVAYKTGENLDPDQAQWLSLYPDFNWDQEVAEATKIAEAVKASGWEFASHTWGHLSVTGKSVETLATDNEKWVNTVQNIVGPVDTIIFAHGNDIGDWHDYDAATNELYAYYKSAGYNFYANVDASTEAWVQIRDQYMRQGRIDCDGLQMWRALSGTASTNVFVNLFDVQSVFSEERPTPVSATGKA